MKRREHIRAIEMRSSGMSVKEIAAALDVAQSTASLWARDVQLSRKANTILRGKVTAGVLKSATLRKERTKELNATLQRDASNFVYKNSILDSTEKILCALMYWCEGAKSSTGGIAFTNSDPALVKLFITLLVRHFDIDPARFVCRLHLHSYHNEQEQIAFWSKSIEIPVPQFRKPYWKPNTKIRYCDGYPGCISVRYYDSILARKVMYLAKAYIDQTGA